MGFQEDYNPYDTTEGFRIGQFKTFISDNPQENSSYVIIPSEAINKTQGKIFYLICVNALLASLNSFRLNAVGP